ncbi:MAG: mechanosensitive ion channel family protein [Acidobacteriota bacterium]
MIERLEIPTNLEDFLAWFGDNVYLQAAVVVVLSFILARIAVFFWSRVFGQIARRTSIEIDDQIITLLRRPIFYSVILAGFGTALDLLALRSPFDFIGAGLIATVAVLVWTVFGIRLTVAILGWMTSRPDRFQIVQPPTLPLFEITAKIILVGLAIYFFFISWGIDVTAWVASAGIVGIVLGLAARDSLANLFAGLFILTDAPYRVGDFIDLATGERGQVTQIGMRSTRILTRDDIEINIPNSIMGNSMITNESAGPSIKHRIRVPVGVAYGSDIDKVRDVLVEAAKSEKLVAEEPSPRARFRHFGNSSLDFELLCWISDPTTRGRIIHSLNTAIYKGFAEAGIVIPFPQRDLWIKEMPQKNLTE